MMKELFHNPYFDALLLNLLMIGIMALLADGQTPKVRKIKRIVASLAVTVIVWAPMITTLWVVGDVMPPVPHIASPKVTSTCSYTVQP